MGWRVNSVEEERLKFIQEVLNSNTILSFKEVCDKYNISTKTGYKWFNRFLSEGLAGLKDQSKARLFQDKIEEDIERYIIAIRKEYPTWGPKKIKALMVYNKIEAPSESSIGNILKKHQLSKPRKFRRHVAKTAPLTDCYDSNDVWMYDFKGWFKTGDGKKCEPLTITDGHSRYLIECEHMKRKREEDVWKVMERTFLEYGLPKRIRSDNGPPFATTSVGRLSRLAIKLIKVGITPEWIEPGCPEQNGRHERFHLTLKQETASPPALSLTLQVEKFKQFKEYYNYKRPHEALDFQMPGSVYQVSSRKWNGKFVSPEYSEEYDVRKVESSGHISWKGHVFFISELLQQEYVGIKQASYDLMEIYYGTILLGKIDLDKGWKRV